MADDHPEQQEPPDTAEPVGLRIVALEHNLRVVLNRLDAISDVLDALVLAMRSVENRADALERRVAIVERAIPYRAPKPQQPPRPRR